VSEKDIHSPHDHLVRTVLARKESAISYLRGQLPEELSARKPRWKKSAVRS
jgi:hypothetical protein